METVRYLEKQPDTDGAEMEILGNQVQELDEDRLLQYISQLESKWCLDCKGDRWVPIKNSFEQYYSPEKLDENGFPDDYDMDSVYSRKCRRHKILAEMLHRSVQLEIASKETIDINNDEFHVITRINRLIDMTDDAYETIFRHARQYERINHPTMVCSDPASDNSMFRCTTMNLEDDKLTPYQHSLLSVLNETYEKKYRKYKGQVCKQIYTGDNCPTKAWKAIKSIEEFVYGFAQKETRFDVWKNITSKGNIPKDVIKFISDSNDIQFPEIKKNRHVWSFNNGLFVGKQFDMKTGKYISKFYPYDSHEFACLDPTIVSAKYFDQHFQHFDHLDNWRDIPTPVFQSILDYQKFEPEVANWMYVMGGKMCFNVNDIDSWQVIPFLKGIAGSGKSTIITKIFKKFYETDDVRTLSNNVEKKFGLSSIYDGFMFIAPEVKGDMCLEQAEFQSLVSGEDISIACKHAKAKSIEWVTPGIMGGNEVPSWKDNSGSVLRRILSWNFGKKVMHADPHLDEKLEKELPIILLKCVNAYLDYAQKYSDQDIWNVVPPYFKTIQNQVAMVTNSLQNFLSSEKIEYGPDKFCLQTVFVAGFNQHCLLNNLGKFKFNPDFYAGPFSSREIEVRSEARTYKGRAYPAQPIIFGLDIKDEGIQFANDEV